jgi:hypothetical protein
MTPAFAKCLYRTIVTAYSGRQNRPPVSTNFYHMVSLFFGFGNFAASSDAGRLWARYFAAACVAATAGGWAMAPPLRAQSRPFGVGVLLGAPTGVSAKYWMTDDRAVDLAAAWSLDEDEGIQLLADHVWHTTQFEGLQEDRSYAYYGVGVRLLAGDEHTALGVRGPFGATYLFPDAPFDVFIEVVPFFDLVPATRLGLQLGIGGRYYFTPRNARP